MPIERVDLTAFSPDLRPDQPSIIVDSDQMFPTTRGLRTLPYPIESGPSLPGGWCYGAFEARYLDETRRRFGGDNDSIQELVNGIWVDRTGGGQTYTMPSRGRWRWVQFGDVTLATNGSATDPLQGFHADSPGDGFLPVDGLPPHAKCITAAQNFVFLANLLPASGSGQQVDSASWWTSGIADFAEWTPALATQSSNGYLYDTPGEITAAHSVGRDIIVYKNRSMYKFEYIGPPVVWANQILSQTAGTWGQESVIDIGGTHVFMGYDDFYIYDGSGAPRSIPSPLREWMFEGWGEQAAELDKNFGHAIWGRWDRELNLVFWHYPSTNIVQTNEDQVVLDRWVCWNIGSDKWMRGSQNVAAAINPEVQNEPGLTYGGLGVTYAQWDTPDAETWVDSDFTGSTISKQGVFSSDDNKLYTYVGSPQGAKICCGDFGAGPDGYTFVHRIRPLFLRQPADLSNFTARVYGRENLTDPTPAIAASESTLGETGWFDVRSDARDHRIEIDMSEDVEIIAIDIEYESGTGVR